MNTTKKINVNFSSLVGLKAELLRKQIEVNEAKQKAEPVRVAPKIKKKVKKHAEAKAQDYSEKLTDVDDINAHKKSKLMLEAKTRLYERLKKSKNNNDNFLVDFTNKSDESEEEPLKETLDNDEIMDNEDDWVEYEDCFGRTRKCLREDLPFMQEKDDLIKEQIMSRKENELRHRNNIEQNSVIIEKEPEIEIMRRKWEEQTQKLTDKVNVHYQDILFDEARAHGVGYYAFSQDEEERSKQQENLFNLRKETEERQKEMTKLKEMREKMEQNRLKAAKIRQRIRAGLPAEPTEEELAQEDNAKSKLDASESISTAGDAINTSATEVNENGNDENKNDNIKNENNEENNIVAKENKIKALGDLLGKRNHWYEMSQEEWVDKCRKVRINEFGPVYENFKSAGYINFENSQNNEESHPNKVELQNRSQDNLEGTVLLPTSSSVQPDVVAQHNVNNSQNTSPQAIFTNETNQTDYPTQLIMPQNLTANYAYNTSSYTDNTLLSNTDSHSQSHTLNSIKSSPELNVSYESTMYSNNTLQDQTTMNRRINEESIVAGLRYLREKFEESQNG